MKTMRMRRKFSAQTFTAIIAIAMAFTFNACGSDDSSGGGGSGNNSGSNGGGGDIKDYDTVTIGTQTWMKENLNVNVEGSLCHSDPDKCAMYGRLYDWATAMKLPAKCNEESCASQIKTPHQGLCPNGWHLPTYTEWKTLAEFVESDKGCAKCDGTLLKAKSGWDNYTPQGESEEQSGNGTDDYGFAALPGGAGQAIYMVMSGLVGWWWTASESDLDVFSDVFNGENAYIIQIASQDKVTALGPQFKEYYKNSIRCIKD